MIVWGAATPLGARRLAGCHAATANRLIDAGHIVSSRVPAT